MTDNLKESYNKYNEKKPTVGFRADPELLEEIQEIASAQQLSQADAIRLIVRTGIDHLKDNPIHPLDRTPVPFHTYL